MPPSTHNLRRGALALLDQSLASGARFILLLIIGRYAGPATLGCYAVGMALVAITLCLQESLLHTPYTARIYHLPPSRITAYRSRVIKRSIYTACLGSVVALAVACALFLTSSSRELVVTFFAVAFCLPAILLRENARRIELAEQRVDVALRLDLVSTAVLLSLLAIIVLSPVKVGLPVVFLSMAIASVATTVPWLRSRIELDATPLDEQHVADDRATGIAVLTGTLATQLAWQSTGWLVAYFLSTHSVGIFTASLSIVFLSNPFVLGLNNVIGPALAKSHATNSDRTLNDNVIAHRGANESSRAVRRNAYLAALLMGVAMSMFVTGIWLYGDWATNSSFGAAYVGQQKLLLLLGVSVAILATFLPIDDALWVIGSPNANAWASSLGLLVTVLIAWLLLPSQGIEAAGIALLSGSIVETLVRWPAFHFATRNRSHASRTKRTERSTEPSARCVP